MLKRSFVLGAAVALVLVTGYAVNPVKADQTHRTVVIQVERTSPGDGKAMYQSYCASCHGTDGRGGGPMAAGFRPQPTDLTLLAKNNRGKYPDTHVVSALLFGPDVPAHRAAQMPVWGPALGKITTGHGSERTLRISNLCQYLRSIQAE